MDEETANALIKQAEEEEWTAGNGVTSLVLASQVTNSEDLTPAAYLSQAEHHQVIFMKFSKKVNVSEHSHESPWGIVLEGRIDLTIGGIKRTYVKGDRYYIAKGVSHSATIFAGYADITFFNQADRYQQIAGKQ